MVDGALKIRCEFCVGGERERERDRERDRQTDRDRDRQTETDRQTDRQKDRQTDGDRHKHRDRQTQTDRQRETERDRESCALTDVTLVEFMYLVFTRIPGESYRTRLMPLLLYLCDVCRALINSLVCWF